MVIHKTIKIFIFRFKIKTSKAKLFLMFKKQNLKIWE